VLSTTQWRCVPGSVSRKRSVPRTVSALSNALPNGFGVLGPVFSSTRRFFVPSTSKSMRKLKKCWWLGAAIFGATVAPFWSPSAVVLTPRLSVVPVAPARTSIPPSMRNTYSVVYV
jgi:hypothetical protein